MNLRLIDEYSRERFKFASDWRSYRWSCAKDECPEGFVKVSGAVAPLKSNGDVNWKKSDKTTEAAFFVKEAEYEDWWNARADARGVCRVCLGDFKVWCGWSITAGNRFKPCPKCQSHQPNVITSEREEQSASGELFPAIPATEPNGKGGLK